MPFYFRKPAARGVLARDSRRARRNSPKSLPRPKSSSWRYSTQNNNSRLFPGIINSRETVSFTSARLAGDAGLVEERKKRREKKKRVKERGKREETHASAGEKPRALSRNVDPCIIAHSLALGSASAPLSWEYKEIRSDRRLSRERSE